MAITAKQVKELREMTGAGMMDCKKALTATDGDFDKAIEFNPGDDMAYHQRGYCYCLLARVTTTPSYFNKALPDFNQSLQLNPSNIESYLYRGMAKAELNGANAGMADIEYAMKEYQRTGDTNGYQRSVEIYNWIKQDY